MFMEFAVWAAWMPVLAARLLGPLKMSGKQTGWIYATLPLASMISPLIAGQLADKYLDTRWILAFCHAAGIALLFLAAKTTKFKPLFIIMLVYSMLYAATLPLVNSLMFRHLTDPNAQSAGIFIWAPVAWALIGWVLSGYRNLSKGDGDGSDCLKFAAILSAIMTAVCFIQPATPPLAGTAGGDAIPMLKALGLLSSFTFALFILASLVISGMMQFYFLGTAQFLQDLGASGKNVSAIMGIAQAAQALATLFALGLLYEKLGPKWTIAIGATCWAILYVVYTIKASKAVVTISQVFHGFAYVFFIIAGQIYVNNYAPKEISGSAQALIFFATTGVGLFLGTQLAGFTMDRSSVAGKFNWSKVFTVPLVLTVIGILALLFAFKAP
jgi:nucleoside transporter